MKSQRQFQRQKVSLHQFINFVVSLLVLLFVATPSLQAQDVCDINNGWWKQGFKRDKEGYLALKSGIKDGDTLHQASCQVPRRGISASDLKYYEFLKRVCFPKRTILIKEGGFEQGLELEQSDEIEFIGRYRRPKCVKIKTFCYQVDLPENAPDSMYQLWKYEYIVEDTYCGRTYKKCYYLAIYDSGAPVFQCMPRDTTVASAADITPPSGKEKIIDLCQYVAWDSIAMIPLLNEDGDTIGMARRWMARDPSGNESYHDQNWWFKPSGSSELKSRIAQARISDSEWKVYPNPAQNELYINIKTDQQTDFILYDGLGRSVKSGQYIRGKSIQLSNMDPGLYHLQLRTQMEVLGTRKVLIVD